VSYLSRAGQGIGPREAIAARHASIERFVAETAAMPILDSRSPRETADDLNAI
jgi:hypothetical protein